MMKPSIMQYRNYKYLIRKATDKFIDSELTFDNNNDEGDASSDDEWDGHVA